MSVHALQAAQALCLADPHAAHVLVHTDNMLRACRAAIDSKDAGIVVKRAAAATVFVMATEAGVDVLEALRGERKILAGLMRMLDYDAGRLIGELRTARGVHQLPFLAHFVPTTNNNNNNNSDNNNNQQRQEQQRVFGFEEAAENAVLISQGVVETALRAIASICVIVSDTDAPRLDITTSDWFGDFIHALIKAATTTTNNSNTSSNMHYNNNSNNNSAYQSQPHIDSIRYHAVMSLACLCHVPCQLDPLASSPSSTVITHMHRNGLIQGISSIFRLLLHQGRDPSELAHVKAIADKKARANVELTIIDTLLFACDIAASLSCFPGPAKDMSVVIPHLASIINGNRLLFGGDHEKIEQSDAHFKTVGVSVHLGFHVTHFSPSAYYSALIALANLADYGVNVDAIDLNSPWIHAERSAASRINKECGNELFKLKDYESALWR